MTDFNTASSVLKMGLVFLEGLLSFLSPCVIPILPIYIGILAGKKEMNEHGELVFNKRNTITNTLSFVLGICSTFFILAFATSFISIFLNENIKTLQIVSGVLIIFMGLLQLGVFKIGFLKQEFSIKNKVKRKGNKTTPILAFLMGFTFSFSWTPCIGPILAHWNNECSSNSCLLLRIYLTIHPCSILRFKIIRTIQKTYKHSKIYTSYLRNYPYLNRCSNPKWIIYHFN